MILFTQNIQNKQKDRDSKQTGGCLGLWVGVGRTGSSSQLRGTGFCGIDEKVLNLDYGDGDGCMTLKY